MKGKAMISYCTRCWAEVDTSMKQCPRCGADLTQDQRSYVEKIMGALEHPLPEARVRACWLLGTNHVDSASERLMEVARQDEDLFVRRAAVEALGHLRAPKVVPFLESLANSEDHWVSRSAKEGLSRLQGDVAQ